jgi:uroporphyrinogen-III decarboxylase
MATEISDASSRRQDPIEQKYQERLARYLTAMRNEQPDRIPIRPFVAEFTAKYAGMDCQQVTQDYQLAFDAAVRCATDFDWDAVVANMVYVWGTIPQVLGTKYLAIPGVGLERDVGFQYREPPEDEAWMKPDEYDALIEDPTGYLLNVWMPRTNRLLVGPGESNTAQNNVAWLKGGMAVMQYFTAFGPQVQRLRDECGTVSAIAGILKSPFDIIADKFRGYIGLTMDLFERPEKVLAAAEALMPHMLHVALSTADPGKQVPITIWMHRGCVPFVTPEQFDKFFWPTLKPIIEEIWANGHQTLFYAEGKWKHHWDSFRELPEASIIYHCDRDDVFEAHRALGDRFAISGGIPNYLLSFGKPQEVRDFCQKVIDEVAVDGGYIMDAGAIMQNDTSIENVQAMTDYTREHGVY